jgi:hypothetical protein
VICATHKREAAPPPMPSGRDSRAEYIDEV